MCRYMFFGKWAWMPGTGLREADVHGWRMRRERARHGLWAWMFGVGLREAVTHEGRRRRKCVGHELWAWMPRVGLREADAHEWRRRREGAATLAVPRARRDDDLELRAEEVGDADAGDGDEALTDAVM